MKQFDLAVAVTTALSAIGRHPSGYCDRQYLNANIRGVCRRSGRAFSIRSAKVQQG